MPLTPPTHPPQRIPLPALFCWCPPGRENPESFLPERFLQPGAEYASAGPLGREAAAAAAEAGDGTRAAATAGGAEAVVRRAAGRSNLDGGGSIGSRSGTGCVSLPEHGGGDGGGRTFTTAGAVDRRAAAAEPLRFFPFSQGARDCVGQSLARVNYTATLAALLGRFAFQLAHEVCLCLFKPALPRSPLSVTALVG